MLNKIVVVTLLLPSTALATVVETDLSEKVINQPSVKVEEKVTKPFKLKSFDSGFMDSFDSTGENGRPFKKEKTFSPDILKTQISINKEKGLTTRVLDEISKFVKRTNETVWEHPYYHVKACKGNKGNELEYVVGISNYLLAMGINKDNFNVFLTKEPNSVRLISSEKDKGD